MNEAKLNILLKGIRIKIEKGEELEVILTSYTKLTDEEKEEIRTKI